MIVETVKAKVGREKHDQVHKGLRVIASNSRRPGAQHYDNSIYDNVEDRAGRRHSTSVTTVWGGRFACTAIYRRPLSPVS